MKKLALLSLPLLLAACGGGSAPGASVVTVTADKTTVTMTPTDTGGTTTFTFTNKAGSREATINSATLTWTDPTTKAATTQTVNVAAFTLPAGLTCAAVAANPSASCNFNDAGTTYGDRTLTRTITNSELFGKVLAANPSVTGLPVTVQFNNANALPFTFTSVAASEGGGVVTAPPKPAIIVNNSSYQTNPSTPISNTLSVTVSAGAAAGVGLKQLILEVTDAKGIVDTTTYSSTQETVTFNIDTTKYPDGALKLRAIAIDALDRRGETANITTVNVANQVSPSIRLTNPVNGGEVTGITPIVVQFQQNNTPFTFVDGKTTIEVVDSGDRIITVQQADIVKVNDGLWEARSQIDLNSPQYINGTYTLRAKANVQLSGATSASTVMTASTFVNKSRVDEAPALNILMPAYYGGSNTLRPVLTRKSAVVVQASDSNNVRQINLRFVCNPAEVLPGQNCNTNVYSYNIPVNKAGIQYRLFNTGVLMDGEPYLPDGYYTMRATATDDTNFSSFREMKVEVNRAKNGIAGLGYNRATTFELAASKLTPAGAQWQIDGETVNETRIIELFYNSNADGIAREIPSAIGIDTSRAGGSAITSGRVVFPAAGTYATSFVVQDMTTGVVEFYDGANIIATPKP
ncbi:hypothetical protein GCM10008955_05590 [Deinococcus malanensis]|uniref:Ig-like domain-containing protein n=1 Tax=Deinococcus malanensis TaxID=1706855 RepID=A0ABQ2EL17_9DEIO|nr:hypothetical protein [Deinococcus malanensis]GGK15120.1 hypothetical protein GCM10008955_05590 [Deinococcus malanensis]